MDDTFFIISFLFIIGIILFVAFIYFLYKSKQTLFWKETVGEIIKIGIDKREGDRKRKSLLYQPFIEYTYIIDERRYESKRIFFGDFMRTTSLNYAQKIINRLSKRNQVRVFYNQMNPEESVLEKGINPIIYLLLICGIWFWGFAVFILCGFVKVSVAI